MNRLLPIHIDKIVMEQSDRIASNLYWSTYFSYCIQNNVPDFTTLHCDITLYSNYGFSPDLPLVFRKSYPMVHERFMM